MASEDYATEGQIKRLYAVLHSVGLDPKQWKKDQNIASFAKLTRAQCSAFIDEVELIEAEQKLQTSQPPAQQKEGFGDRANAEAEKIRQEQGRTTTPEGEETPAPPKPTLPELIAKYVEILSQVTEAVAKEERIPDREKGYAVKFIYYSVKAAIENGKGGDHEEQA